MKITRTTFEPGDDETFFAIGPDGSVTENDDEAIYYTTLTELQESRKFRAWKPQKPKVLKAPAGRAGEAHYSPQELAAVWGVSSKVIRQIFRQEEGVLKVGREGTRNRQSYWTLRIPESVAERVHRRLSA